MRKEILLGIVGGLIGLLRPPVASAQFVSQQVIKTQEEVYAITDVMVTDDVRNVPSDHTGISNEQLTLPYIPGQVGGRVGGVNVNHKIGGTTTSIWVKYQLLPRNSSTPVLVDLQVRHWVDWKVSLPTDNGWKPASGWSAKKQGALTAGTKGKVWKNGLAVRYLPLQDAKSWVLALYLSVTSSNTPSAPPAEFSWPSSMGIENKVLTLRPGGIDIHKGGGGNYYYIMAYSFADTMTVLTYNTHLFGGSHAILGNKLNKLRGKKEKILVYKDDERAALIVDRIRQSGSDVVGLQEIWSKKRQSWLCEQLSDVYPYSFYTGEPPLIVGSGLVILSKYKLIDKSFKQFPRHCKPIFSHMSDEECFATKGVIASTVELSPGGMMLRVGISQAHTDAGDKDPSKQPNISLLIHETMWSGFPALMMGDLNVSGKNKEEYEPMERKFKAAGAANAYMKVRSEVNEGDYTTDYKNNRLDRYFTPNRPGREGDRLDYVFVKEAGDGYSLKPVEAEVLRDWTFDDRPGSPWDLSDHFPVKVKFALTRIPASVKR